MKLYKLYAFGQKLCVALAAAYEADALDPFLGVDQRHRPSWLSVRLQAGRKTLFIRLSLAPAVVSYVTPSTLSGTGGIDYMNQAWSQHWAAPLVPRSPTSTSSPVTPDEPPTPRKFPFVPPTFLPNYLSSPPDGD